MYPANNNTKPQKQLVEKNFTLIAPLRHKKNCSLDFSFPCFTPIKTLVVLFLRAPMKKKLNYLLDSLTTYYLLPQLRTSRVVDKPRMPLVLPLLCWRHHTRRQSHHLLGKHLIPLQGSPSAPFLLLSHHGSGRELEDPCHSLFLESSALNWKAYTSPGRPLLTQPEPGEFPLSGEFQVPTQHMNGYLCSTLMTYLPDALPLALEPPADRAFWLSVSLSASLTPGPTQSGSALCYGLQQEPQ